MLIKTFKNISTPNKRDLKNSIFRILIILLLIFISRTIIYIFGGSSSALVHLLYIPILVTVFNFGTKEGILIAIIAGISVGPFMPLNAADGTMQPTFSWIFRTVMFVIIVLIVGFLVDHIRKINDLEKKEAYEDIITGYPNLNKLKNDLNNIIHEHIYKSFSLIIFKYENLDMINRHVDHETGQKSLIELLHMADKFFSEENIYSINPNKFVVICPNNDCEEAYDISNKFLHITKKPVYINDLPISFIVKGGIVYYPYHSDESADIIMKLDKALDQASRTQKNIAIYDNNIEDESGVYYNILVSLYEALQNDVFNLVYQPKINLQDKFVGAEVLLRWNNSTYNDFPISRLIKIAEDAGFISEVTKWVIKKVVIQQKSWQKEGLNIKVAINLSSMDLIDDSIIKYTIETLKINDIDPSLIEFELTERTVIEDEMRVFNLLKKIKDYGIKISLDDYGSGYNSLKYLINNTCAFNCIKIDKILIDNIASKHNMIMIEAIIKAVHEIGLDVVAEGVETEAQVNVLKSIGCDTIQGFYYSKPLPPEELKAFVLKWSD